MTPDQRKLLAIKAEIAELNRQRAAMPRVSPEAELAAAVRAGTKTARAHLRRAFNPRLERLVRMDACRAAIEALPLKLQQLAAEGERAGRRRGWVKLGMKRSITEVAQEVLALLEKDVRGHGALPGDKKRYVQEEDLDELIPDGWGKHFTLEAKWLSRHSDVQPLAIPLLCILVWCGNRRERRDKDGCGAGLQCRTSWLARKLGCSTTHVKRIFNRLDPAASYRREVVAAKKYNARREPSEPARRMPPKPTGTIYAHRFRRTQKLGATPQKGKGGAHFWLDAAGVVRSWVDLRGVLYLTDAGRALLLRRAWAPRARVQGNKVTVLYRGAHGATAEDALVDDGYRPVEAVGDLSRRLRPVSVSVRRRLEAVEKPVEKPVENADWKTTGPPLRRAASR